MKPRREFQEDFTEAVALAMSLRAQEFQLAKKEHTEVVESYMYIPTPFSLDWQAEDLEADVRP